eukprot:3655453-Amphidinium_carterae.1
MPASQTPLLHQGFERASSCEPECTVKDMALDYIAKRGPTVGAPRDVRIQYARELLQKELLPHIGRSPYCE